MIRTLESSRAQALMYDAALVEMTTDVGAGGVIYAAGFVHKNVSQLREGPMFEGQTILITGAAVVLGGLGQKVSAPTGHRLLPRTSTAKDSLRYLPQCT